MKKLAKDFKAFITRGNVVDMAVGVIIGTAFGKIVSSLVADIVMPLITLLTGKKSFGDLKWIITPLDEAAGIAENAVRYGAFIQFIIDFLIIALVIFFVVKVISSLREGFGKLGKKKAAAEAPAPEEPKAPTAEELLTEIRDFLKAQAEAKAETEEDNADAAAEQTE